MPAVRRAAGSTPALVALGAAAAARRSACCGWSGIFGRRLGAGYMQFRLQAAYRRRVTRRYLELPLAWHHRHATGTLLSNANSDVEAAWFPIAPLPFAVGTLVMLVAAVGSLFAHRLGARPGRARRLPGAVRAQRRLLPPDGAPPGPRAAAARRGQRDRPRELRRRAGGQDDGPGGAGDRPVRRPRRRAARRADLGRPAARPLRPDAGDAAQPRHAGRAGGRRGPAAAGRDHASPNWSASRSCSPCWPSRSGRSAGCWPSCRAASPAGTGCSRRARRDRRDAVRRRSSWTRPTAGAGHARLRRRRTSATSRPRRTSPAPRCCGEVVVHRAGRADGRPGRADRLRQVHDRLAGRPAGRPGRRHGPRWTAWTCGS